MSNITTRVGCPNKNEFFDLGRTGRISAMQLFLIHKPTSTV